jgi:O-antigen ligase
MTKERAWVLEFFLILVFLTAPVFFGAVHPWAFLSFSGVLLLLLFFFPDAIFELQGLPSGFTVGMAAVFLFAGIQAFFLSLNRHASLEEFLLWAGCASAFVLMQLLPYSALEHLAALICLSGVSISLYGLYQVVTGTEMILWQKKNAYLGFVTGTFVNRNHMAGYLELCLGLQWGLCVGAFGKRNLWGVSLAVISLAILSAAFLKTGSRMGMLSFTAAFFLLGFPFFRRSTEMAWAGLTFMVFLLVVLGIVGRHFFPERLFDFAVLFRDWAVERQIVWENVFQMSRAHVWTGIGLGTFEWVFPNFQSEVLTAGYRHAHNDYLEIAAEIGLPAFLMLVYSFYCLGRTLFRRFRTVQAAHFPLYGGCCLGGISLLLHGGTDFNFAIPANLMTWFLVIAMAVRISRLDFSQASKGEPIRA